ncbi:transcription factor E2F/dimerization partner, partial [Teladorsagia circumcincta]
MSDAPGQKFDHGQGHVVIKQEKVDYRSPAPARRHGQQSSKLKYPDVRMASCFRPSGLLASDLPVDNKHYVDKSMGLRHFSTKVCEKVKEKGRTNYNQVADELVAEYFAANNMNSEEFLDIDWVGLPATKAGEIKRLEEEKAKLTERIRRKKETIQELIVQLVAYKSLVWKNRTPILLPVSVKLFNDCSTTVDCAVSGDRSEFLFNFDQSFEVHDDFE